MRRAYTIRQLMSMRHAYKLNHMSRVIVVPKLAMGSPRSKGDRVERLPALQNAPPELRSQA